MTLTLELTPTQETEVRARAAARDPDSDAYLAALMRYALDVYTLAECGPAPAPGESALDGMEDLIGTVDSGGDGTLSENTGQGFTEVLVEKKRRGRF